MKSDDNVVTLREALIIRPGQFHVEEGDLPAGVLIEEDNYQVSIEDALLRHYHFGTRLAAC